VREAAAGNAAGRARRVESRRVHLDPLALLARRHRPDCGPRRSRRRCGDRASAHATGRGERGGPGGGWGRVEESGKQGIPRALGDGHGSEMVASASPGGSGKEVAVLCTRRRARAALGCEAHRHPLSALQVGEGEAGGCARC
jgi:hypothetical protein